MKQTHNLYKTTSILGSILAMYIKDITDTFRDRKNLLRMLLLPSLMLPLMGHFMLTFSKNYVTKSQEKVLQYEIVGQQNLPELNRLYESQDNFQLVSSSLSNSVDIDVAEKDARQAIQSGKLDFVVLIPADTQQQLLNGERISLKLLYNNASGNSEIIRSRAAKPLEKLNEVQRDWRLIMYGISGYTAKKKLLEPVRFESLGTASEREIAGQTYGGILCYFIFLLCFMGCIFTAADLVAGEKERCSMETLLQVPVPRYQLVLGKYLVVLTMGLAYITISLCSLSVWLILEGTQDNIVSKSVLTMINLPDILLVWLMLCPVAAIFSGVLLAISAYARSFREATSLSAIANIFVIVAAVVGTLPGMKLTATLAMVPIANVALAIKELIKGTLVDYSLVLNIVVSTTVIALVLLFFCTKMFEREDIIFRE